MNHEKHEKTEDGGIEDGLPAGAGESDEIEAVLGALEVSFGGNTAALLITMVDIYMADNGLETLEEMGRKMAHQFDESGAGSADGHFTERFTAELEALRDHRVIPQGDRAATFLKILAALLSTFSGEPFQGDTAALLEYLGC